MGAESCEKSESLQTFFRNFPHARSLWEQKVAKKVWKLSLSTIIARSGAKVCKLFAHLTRVTKSYLLALDHDARQKDHES